MSLLPIKLSRMDAQARYRWTWLRIEDAGWRSHLQQVKDREQWSGTASDLAATCMAFVVDEGHPQDDVWLAILTDGTPCCLVWAAGTLWIMGHATRTFTALADIVDRHQGYGEDTWTDGMPG